VTGYDTVLDLALVSHEDIVGDLIVGSRIGFRDDKFNSHELNEKVI